MASSAADETKEEDNKSPLESLAIFLKNLDICCNFFLTEVISCHYEFSIILSI